MAEERVKPSPPGHDSGRDSKRSPGAFCELEAEGFTVPFAVRLLFNSQFIPPEFD